MLESWELGDKKGWNSIIWKNKWMVEIFYVIFIVYNIKDNIKDITVNFE